jgi:hypothetical protein
VLEKDPLVLVLGKAKLVAREYRRLTGKPLGVTGEVAEYEAARILKLQLAGPRQEGYDALETVNGITRRLQIKGRCYRSSSRGGRMVSSIDIRNEFDAVLLVLLDESYDALAIYEADRRVVVDELRARGSRARNERNALSISRFKRISTLRWHTSPGADPTRLSRSAGRR